MPLPSTAIADIHIDLAREARQLEHIMKLTIRHRFAVFGALLVAAGAMAAGAMAFDEGDEPANDAVPVSQAAISMVQAIQTAELRASGKARRAEYESSKQGWVYEIEVINGNKVFDVRVSATDGTVLSAQEDVPDRDGHKGREGRDDDKE